jgi:transposase
VAVGIETDRGLWVRALVAAGYTVFAINPLQASRYRDRHGVSGSKSDAADAHVLADMVRTDFHQLRPVAGDSARVDAIKVVSRMHNTLIWERTRCTQRLRHALRDYFPAALQAFEDLDAPDARGHADRQPGRDRSTGRRLSRRSHRRTTCPRGRGGMAGRPR